MSENALVDRAEHPSMRDSKLEVVARVRSLLRGPLAMAAIFSLNACTGDTLYDSVGPGGVPEVEIVSPTGGSQLIAGQRVPIQVAATDDAGVSSVTIRVTGVATETITLTFTPPRTSVVADTAFTVPAQASGAVQLLASAINTDGLEGQGSAVQLGVSGIDAVPPFASLAVELSPRMELEDEIRVTVRAFDNPGGGGVVRTALTAIVANGDRSDSLVVEMSENHTAGSDTVESVFTFTPPFVDPLSLPDTLHILFFGLATDAEGNCSGAVMSAFGNGVACDTVLVDGVDVVVANAVTEAENVIAVSGRSSASPQGGVLADLLVDTLRSRVYVSNHSRNRINILETDNGLWGPEVWVGSEPWGLDWSENGDSLYVANSGGTSLSFVSLTGTPTEDLGRRFVTQNTPLFEITKEFEGEDKFEKLEGIFIDYSDRPQFIARDADDRLLYSTRPTSSASEGTVRVVTHEPGWASPEAKILLLTEDIQLDTTKVAIAHVDSIDLYHVSGDHDLVEIFDHKPGFPDMVVSSGVLQVKAALTALSANPDSDVLWAEGSWVRDRLALQDTTFVSASGDREWVAFGEGGGSSERAGRITLWDASATKIHRRLLVADLLNNASEHVTGLDLNYDGTLGAARGGTGSYYWSTDLRLQGSVTTSTPGGAGAALHPYHPSYVQGLASSDLTLSFVGQSDNTIRILDTVHFTERGQIHIRDILTGPLRASPPLPSDNGGLGQACGGPDCVVVKLYGITDLGGLVVVDVLRRDIQPL